MNPSPIPPPIPPMSALLRRPAAVLWLALFSLAYGATIFFHMSEAYVDFGDGNYLYIARRLTEGLTLYRDILSPQPPVHVFLGAGLLRLGDWLGEPLATVRLAMMALRVLTMWIVAALAFQVFRKTCAAVAAGLLFLLVPIGFWWAMGYQSEHFEMAFLLASTGFFLRFQPRSMVVAGLLAAGGPLCNMTALPFLIFNVLFLAVCRRRLLPYYLAPLVAVLAVVTIGFQWATEGAFLDNVFFNQVGSFPRQELLGPDMTVAGYMLSKLASEGLKVLLYEGAWIVWAVAGLFFVPPVAGAPMRSYVAWLLVAGLLSIVFVVKGGTVEYIFTLGEPILCVVAGGLWAAVLSPRSRPDASSADTVSNATDADGPPSPARLRRRRTWIAPTLLVAGTLHFTGFISWVVVGGAQVLAGREEVYLPTFGARLIYQTLQGRQYEMNHHATVEMLDHIERHSQPGDAIIAHPYLAFLSQRRLVAEYAEVFLWTVKYHNERLDGTPGDGMAAIETLAEALRRREVPLVILDVDQTGSIDEIREALNAGYRQALVWPRELTLNFRFILFVPRPDAAAEPLPQEESAS